MSVNYRWIKTPRSESIVVSGNFTRTIASTSPRFEAVKQYLLNTPEEELDGNRVLRLIDAGEEAVAELRKLSERVALHNGNITFDGDPLDNALATHIVRMIRDGSEYAPFVRFLENISINPSQVSKESLFAWLKDRDFTIDSDGFFLAYKGLNADFKSIHSGYGIVDGVEFKNDHLLNLPGSVVEIPRSMVDENRAAHCSVGLHAGTHDYASGFSDGKLVLVRINPRDVVSVPTDHSSSKLRVARYEVIEEVESALTESVYKGAHRWEGSDSAEGSYEPEDDLEDGYGEWEDETCDYCGDTLNDYNDGVCDDCSYEEGEDEDTAW